MLSSIRKFSSSIYAKIFLFIVAIPFVFWGMGPVFTGGNLNTIVKIGKNKIPTNEFINFLRYHASEEEILDEQSLERFLSKFIGEKLIQQEISDFEIKLTDKSLSKIIKNEKIFQKNNEFSRTEYEKFLIKNSLSAPALESNILNQEKKDQLFNFIGGGVVPPSYIVKATYNKIHQKRNVQYIYLNEIFKKKFTFTDKEIQTYYNKNLDFFKNTFKLINFIKLNPKNLTGNDEFDDLFFKKIDEIDDLIVEGKGLDFILTNYNLGSATSIFIDKNGLNKQFKKIEIIPSELIPNILNINESEATILVEQKDNFFIFQYNGIESVQRKFSENSVKNRILDNLKKNYKRKSLSEIISKINKNIYTKDDFDKLSKDENVPIYKVALKSLNDDEKLKKDIVEQIYGHPNKKVIAITDVAFSENYLVYVDSIENAQIEENSEDYVKYSNFAKKIIENDLYNTYDSYLNIKYKIDINYKALNSIKNNF